MWGIHRLFFPGFSTSMTCSSIGHKDWRVLVWVYMEVNHQQLKVTFWSVFLTKWNQNACILLTKGVHQKYIRNILPEFDETNYIKAYSAGCLNNIHDKDSHPQWSVLLFRPRFLNVPGQVKSCSIRKILLLNVNTCCLGCIAEKWHLKDVIPWALAWS